jgi:hypothetical protein
MRRRFGDDLVCNEHGYLVSTIHLAQHLTRALTDPSAII